MAPRVGELLGSFRIVILGCARQTGKTTLLQLPGSAWLNFDDPAVLERAVDDPVGFVEGLPQPAVIDEFQRAGRGLLAVKQMVDRDRARGQLLLTGSTNYLADRSLTETLAGRAGRLTLRPLSMGERSGVLESFLDRVFEPQRWPRTGAGMPRAQLVDLVLQGGYPEVVAENMSERARDQWFDGYVRDVVSRESLRPLAEVRLEIELRRPMTRCVACKSPLLATASRGSNHEGQRLVPLQARVPSHPGGPRHKPYESAPRAPK